MTVLDISLPGFNVIFLTVVIVVVIYLIFSKFFRKKK